MGRHRGAIERCMSRMNASSSGWLLSHDGSIAVLPKDSSGDTGGCLLLRMASNAVSRGCWSCYAQPSERRICRAFWATMMKQRRHIDIPVLPTSQVAEHCRPSDSHELLSSFCSRVCPPPSLQAWRSGSQMFSTTSKDLYANLGLHMHIACCIFRNLMIRFETRYPPATPQTPFRNSHIDRITNQMSEKHEWQYRQAR